MKRAPTKTKTINAPPSAKSPWATLYDLESQIGVPRPHVEKRRVGRPARPIPRKRTLLELTDGELRALRQLTAQLQELFDSNRVTRSQVAGFALQVLAAQMAQTKLPTRAAGWDTLITALLEQNRG